MSDVPESKPKYGQKSYNEAMNAPNTPRPMGSPDKARNRQGEFDREKESYNVTYDYCPDNDD